MSLPLVKLSNNYITVYEQNTTKLCNNNNNYTKRVFEYLSSTLHAIISIVSFYQPNYKITKFLYLDKSVDLTQSSQQNKQVSLVKLKRS